MYVHSMGTCKGDSGIKIHHFLLYVNKKGNFSGPQKIQYFFILKQVKVNFVYVLLSINIYSKQHIY